MRTLDPASHRKIPKVPRKCTVYMCGMRHVPLVKRVVHHVQDVECNEDSA